MNNCRKHNEMPLLDSRSIASSDNHFRYTLRRDLQNDLLGSGTMLFIGLNPSVADAENDDPTIRRLKAFAVAFGFSRLSVGNLFAYRSKSPMEMLHSDDPVGPENDRYLCDLIAMSDKVLCGWGNLGRFRDRDQAVLKMIGQKAYCLKVNADGTPAHPLYLRKDLRLIPYSPDNLFNLPGIEKKK